MTTLVALDRDAFVNHVEDVVAIWRAAFGEAAYAELDSETERRAAAMIGHAQQEGFRAWCAVDDRTAIVGFAYGCTGRAGTYWHDTVSALLPPELAQRWLRGAFEVCELHVIPARQGEGIGRRLLRALVDAAPGPTAVLSTWQGDTRARRLYDSFGFDVIVDDITFIPRGHPYIVLGVDLPLP